MEYFNGFRVFFHCKVLIIILILEVLLFFSIVLKEDM